MKVLRALSVALAVAAGTAGIAWLVFVGDHRHALEIRRGHLMDAALLVRIASARSPFTIGVPVFPAPISPNYAFGYYSLERYHLVEPDRGR